MQTITFETHAVIQKLEQQKLGTLGFDPLDSPSLARSLPWLIELWQEHSPHFAKSIKVVDPAVQHRLAHRFSQLLTAQNIQAIPPQACCIVTGATVCCYRLFGESEETFSEVFFLFDDNVLIAAYENNVVTGKMIGYCISEYLSQTKQEGKAWLEQQLMGVFAWAIFLSQTPLSTTLVLAQSQTNRGGKVYQNQARLPVEFIEPGYSLNLN